MTCPACGVENARTRKFCRACGARLPILCAACGSPNEPDDRFCGECGSPLAAGAAPVTPAAPPVAASEERRQVTVLFADLVGFTSLAERLDPEDVRDITTDCLRQLAAEAVRFEGTVDKLIGDAVMILFGAPVAHEDDPARALRAALAMQRALERFNLDLQRRRGLALRLRIGIESGEVVAGPREVGGMVEYTVIGDAVNVAARLQTAAEPGSILAGEGACARVGSAFRLERVEPLTLKGRARPVAAAILHGEAQDGPAPEPRVPLVGRAAELEALSARLAALEAGQGGVAVVVGAPGLGKSRLIAELRTRAVDSDGPGDGVRWVRSVAYAHEQAQSYGLARSLVRALIGPGTDEHDRATARQLHAALASLGLRESEAPLVRLLGLPTGDDGGRLAADLAALDTLEPREVQQRYFEAIVTLVDALAVRQPLVLELDDLHWSDPTSIDLLLELLDRAERASLLLCCAFRPESDAACQILRERGQWRLGERYVEIALRPLSEAASAELVARLLDAALPAESASGLPSSLRALLERAAGTPLWLEELVQMLVERGLLVATESGWQLVGDLAAVELPSSLQALIVARIDRLGPARPTLQVASVIGRRFSRTILELVAEGAGRLDTDLGTAQRADLVREIPARADREYDFKHVLVRDAAYATLLHRRRRSLHRRVAEAVERLYPDRAPELHAILAYHYEHAEAWPQACAHARAAAESARDGYANREAIASYALALRMAERANCDVAERVLLLEGRGGVHQRIGDFEAARADFEAALVLAEQADDDAARVRLLGALGMLWSGHKDYQQGIEWTTRAVALADETGNSRARADASVQLAIQCLNVTRLDDGRRALEDAVSLYRDLDDAHGQARALDILGLFACLDGRLDDGNALLLDARDRLLALGDRGGAVSAGSMRGIPLFMGGQRAEAERWMRDVTALAEELGAPAAESFSWMIVAEGRDPYGAYTRADEAGQRALAIAREIDHREWTLAALGPIGRVKRGRGDLDGALRCHEEMLEIARAVGSGLWTVEALANVAYDRLALGDLDGARAACDEACEMGGPYQKGSLNAWITRAILLLHEGRPADALEEVRATRRRIAAFLVRLPELVVLEGVALERLGQIAEAEAQYRAALDDARTVGAAVGLAQAARALGDLLTGTGRADEAVALRATVEAELDALAGALDEPDLRRTLAAQPVLYAPMPSSRVAAQPMDGRVVPSPAVPAE
jgi:class 3 adenylate cyclase/tetratricopeptide (TPR) repeat protein